MDMILIRNTMKYLIPRTNFGTKGRKLFVSVLMLTEVRAEVLNDHRRLMTKNVTAEL